MSSAWKLQVMQGAPLFSASTRSITASAESASNSSASGVIAHDSSLRESECVSRHLRRTFNDAARRPLRRLCVVMSSSKKRLGAEDRANRLLLDSFRRRAGKNRDVAGKAESLGDGR